MSKSSELDLETVTVNCHSIMNDVEPRLKEICDTIAQLDMLVNQLTQIRVDSNIITSRGHLSKLRHSYGKVSIPREFKKPVAQAQKELGQAVDNFWLGRRVIKDLGYRIYTATRSIIYYIESIPGYVDNASRYLEIWQESDRLLKYARSEELAIYHKILGLRARPPQSPIANQPEVHQESESTMSKVEKKEQIEKLLKQLKKSTDPAEKRKIRKALRELGHVGGLNQPKTFAKKTTKNDEQPKKKGKTSQGRPSSQKPAKTSRLEDIDDVDEDLDSEELNED